MLPTRRIITSGGDVFRDDFSIDFDGTDDYLEIDASFALIFRDSFSISCWFRIEDGHPPSASQSPFGARDGDSRVYFYIQQGGGEDGKLFFQLDVEGTEIKAQSANKELTDGQQPWKHLVVVVAGGAVNKIYMYLDSSFVTLDGTNDGDIGSTDIDDFRSTQNMFIGGANNNGGYALGYAGKISDWALYNTALTASQVATLYNDREPYNHKEGIAASNLVGWWRMGDGRERGISDRVYDQTALGNNAQWDEKDPGGSGDFTSIEYTGDTP